VIDFSEYPRPLFGPVLAYCLERIGATGPPASVLLLTLDLSKLTFEELAALRDAPPYFRQFLGSSTLEFSYSLAQENRVLRQAVSDAEELIGRLSRPLAAFELPDKSRTFPTGIFAHLRDEVASGDASKVVEATASSLAHNDYVPARLFDGNDQNVFATEKTKGIHWVQFDFKEKLVDATAYAVAIPSRKAENRGPRPHALGQCLLEGSLNDHDWRTIDERVAPEWGDRTFLTFPGKSAGLARFIRFRVLPCGKERRLDLSHFELFGRISGISLETD
jgi:hypothetical protein